MIDSVPIHTAYGDLLHTIAAHARLRSEVTCPQTQTFVPNCVRGNRIQGDCISAAEHQPNGANL